MENFLVYELKFTGSKEPLDLHPVLFQPAAFGAGSRICTGKNINMIEIFMIVPGLLRKFEIELLSPEKQLIVENSFFVLQMGLVVSLKHRQRRCMET